MALATPNPLDASAFERLTRSARALPLGGEGRLLEALAVLSPADALQYLAEHADAVAARLERAEIARVLGRAIAALAPSDAREPVLEAVVTRFEAVIDPATFVTLAQLLPPQNSAIVAAALDAQLARAPKDAALLRLAAKQATADGDASQAHGLLTRWGRADTSLGTAMSIARSRAALPPTDAPPVRIALLSSYTIDQLAPYVDLECRDLGLRPELYLAPFNSWTREVLDGASGLRAFDPEIAFFSIAIDDLVPELATGVALGALETLGATAVERVLAAARGYAGWAGGKALVVHAFHSTFATSLGTVDGREHASRLEWLATLNARLAAGLRQLPNAFLLDVQAAANRAGVALKDEPKLRQLAALRLPPPVLPAVARAYAQYVAPLKGRTVKCVVLDLDNTLWGGVVGEDGRSGIRLGETAPGSEFLEFQRFLAVLRERGILLAINSKNNPDDALDVLRNHPHMQLRDAMFSAVRINWQPKPENMQSIAAELNIGVDSLLFFDDNPNEREMMRQLLPSVLTVDVPADPALYRATLEGLPQLQALAVTAEDRMRAGQYEVARKREEAKLEAGSLDEYLHSLQITVAISAATEDVQPRVAQLFARTNQLNTTTRRYGLDDVKRFCADRASRLYVLTSSDQFGDHGLVAVALAQRHGDEWVIDDFLMSCRVIGYGVETALFSAIAADAAADGATSLRGLFIPTKKNAPARDLFSRHGFVRDGERDDAEQWTYDLRPGLIAMPAWIRTVTYDA